jgi:hypothetical protein
MRPFPAIPPADLRKVNFNPAIAEQSDEIGRQQEIDAI